MAETTNHDVLIVGGGPAGLSAGIYSARAGLETTIAEMGAPGGQISISSVLENYPGINSVSGIDFGEMLAQHAEAAGCSMIRDEVTSIKHGEDGLFRTVVGGVEHTSKVVIYAAGSQPRMAGFENEERFTGRGVSYCATCDGMLFRNKPVYVIGSGQSACEEADYLARMTSHVTMLVRGDILKGTASIRQALEENPKVEIRYNTRLFGLEGDVFPESITIEDLKTGERTTETLGARAFGVFVFVGYQPRYQLVLDLVDIENNGIATDSNMRTRTPGLFAAGDVRNTVLRQAVTAVSDGAVAAMEASHFIDRFRRS